jgi:hypothetical protein
VPKPEPASGLVIRYDYLWRDEAKRGQRDGSKDRPCVIVVAIQNVQGGDFRTLVAAVTHTEPEPEEGIEMPTKVKRHLGLDKDPSWIIVSEVNEIDWSDPGIIPASKEKWEYGFVPAPLAAALRDAILARMTKKNLQIIRRK